MINGNPEEQIVPWDNVPTYLSHLNAHYEEFYTIVRRVRNFELDQKEGEKQGGKSLLQFCEKLVTFMKLCNIRIITNEEARNEVSLERIISKIVVLQSEIRL